ncbi:MAG: L-seryl-tRNA(Sec) selenium transferase, partial [Deltaproteobacteria bacterium]|nr:L-seryl-tRNA(Sec) selenium transferase [Deltaproteobacteria bacterium]
MQEIFRRLPGIDVLLDEPELRGLVIDFPKTLVLKAARQTLEELRLQIRQLAPDTEPPDISIPTIVKRIDEKTRALARPNLIRVVNATGVIIHTNLGRSCMSEEALDALETAGRYYSNLEFNLSTGERGSRYSLVEEILCDLSGAEAGLVVNNNAAAVLLVLNSLARDKEVIISRGELVEIGGSFRIPEVMAASGAIMVEVGATNKTHLFDYE